MVNYLYLEAEIEETGEQMPGRPRHTVNARGSFEGLYGDLYAELQYTSQIPTTPVGTQIILARTLVNLGARLNLLALPPLKRWKGIESLSLALDVMNVGNVFPKDVRGVPLPGRTFFGTIQASF
jgi:outer membrane receptor protein involved in Fe transport